MDCRVESFADGPCWRARVIRGEADEIYVTWPYRSRYSAEQRARRWIAEQSPGKHEHERLLFDH